MNLFKMLTLSILLAGLTATGVNAKGRHVVVNGKRLNAQELAQADAAQCTRVPDGFYWLNVHNGAWGYAGNFRIQGYVGDGCRRARGGARRKSLSERGLLYTPGDLNFR